MIALFNQVVPGEIADRVLEWRQVAPGAFVLIVGVVLVLGSLWFVGIYLLPRVLRTLSKYEVRQYISSDDDMG